MLMAHDVLKIALAGILCGLGTTAIAAGNATNGKMLAQQRCTNCHVIAKGAVNAIESQPVGPDFGAMKKIDGPHLKVKLKTAHPVMSKFPDVTDQQAADLAAYIGSVTGK